MKKLILLALAILTIGCTSENIVEQKIQEKNNGTLSFRFKGIDYVVNNEEIFKPLPTFNSIALNNTKDNLNYNSIVFVLPLEHLGNNKTKHIQGLILKSNGTNVITIAEVTNGNTITTTIENPIINIISKNRETINIQFSGLGLENGKGNDIPNKYSN